MKNELAALILAVTFLGAAFLSSPGGERADVEFYSEDEKLADLSLEVADNSTEREIGLMNRTEIGSDGMIFVYPYEQNLAFWMKNTLIPLDMVFIYRNGTVSRIHTAYPEPNTSDDNLTRYRGRGKYVVEVPANFTDKKGINKGDRAEIALP